MENENTIAQIVYALDEYNLKEYEKDTSILDLIGSIIEKDHGDNAFYIVDITTIISKYEEWTRLLPSVTPHYAIKANPNDVIITTLHKLGVKFDCASKNEISQALRLSVKPSDIIFANPCKAEEHLKYARSSDIDLLTFDDKEELKKICLYHPNADLVLRIKVDDSKSQCKFSCKFGCDLKDVRDILKFALGSELNVIGVSFHVGSNCEDVETYYRAVEDCRKVFDIAKELGINMTLLDIGGGFPGTDDAVVTFSDIAKKLNESFDKFFNKESFPDLKIISEPGRYFCAASHTLILNVVSKKKINTNGEKSFVYYLNDGVYGSFNCIVFDHAKPILKPFNEREGEVYKCIVFGPTCDSIDTISAECKLPDLAIGEWVYVENFGAYTRAAASTFNGFTPTPCEYIIRCKE